MSFIGRFWRRQIVATLCGGCYPDSALSPLLNTVHMYLFAVFLLLPVVLHTLVPNHLSSLLVYTGVTLVVFVVTEVSGVIMASALFFLSKSSPEDQSPNNNSPGIEILRFRRSESSDTWASEMSDRFPSDRMLGFEVEADDDYVPTPRLRPARGEHRKRCTYEDENGDIQFYWMPEEEPYWNHPELQRTLATSGRRGALRPIIFQRRDRSSSSSSFGSPSLRQAIAPPSRRAYTYTDDQVIVGGPDSGGVLSSYVDEAEGGYSAAAQERAHSEDFTNATAEWSYMPSVMSQSNRQNREDDEAATDPTNTGALSPLSLMEKSVPRSATFQGMTTTTTTTTTTSSSSQSEEVGVVEGEGEDCTAADGADEATMTMTMFSQRCGPLSLVSQSKKDGAADDTVGDDTADDTEEVQDQDSPRHQAEASLEAKSKATGSNCSSRSSTPQDITTCTDRKTGDEKEDETSLTTHTHTVTPQPPLQVPESQPEDTGHLPQANSSTSSSSSSSLLHPTEDQQHPRHERRQQQALGSNISIGASSSPSPAPQYSDDDPASGDVKKETDNESEQETENGHQPPTIAGGHQLDVSDHDLQEIKTDTVTSQIDPAGNLDTASLRDIQVAADADDVDDADDPDDGGGKESESAGPTAKPRKNSQIVFDQAPPAFLLPILKYLARIPGFQKHVTSVTLPQFITQPPGGPTFVNSLLKIMIGTALSVLCWMLLDHHSSVIPSFFICFTVAGAQFSIIQPLQPDAHSPTPGHTAVGCYSRAFFIVLCGSIVLCWDYYWSYAPTLPDDLCFFAFNFRLKASLAAASWMLVQFIYVTPILFFFGLVPQPNTLYMVIVEAIHIHLFGGTGTLSVMSATYSIAKDLVLTVILCLVGYQLPNADHWSTLTPDKTVNEDLPLARTASTVDPVYGLYCGLLVAFAYLLARTPADPHYMIASIKGIKVLQFKSLLGKVKSLVVTNIKQNDAQSEPSAHDVNAAAQLQDSTSSHNQDDSHSKNPATPTTRCLKDTLIAVVLLLLVGIVQSLDLLSKYSAMGERKSIILHIIMWVTITNGFVVYIIFPNLYSRHPFMFLSKSLLTYEDFSTDTTKQYKGAVKVYSIARKLDTLLQLYILLVFTGDAMYMSYLFAPMPTTTSYVPSCEDFVYRSEKLSHTNLPWFLVPLITVAMLKIGRLAFSRGLELFQGLFLAHMIYWYDKNHVLAADGMPFVILLFICTIIAAKLSEAWNKIRYMTVYCATEMTLPLQPASVPHAQLALAEVILGTILSAPVYTVMGVPVMAVGYPRAVKYWENDYHTHILHLHEMRVQDALSAEYSTDTLNSIFYVHLVVALKRALPSAISSGLLGNISTGSVIMIMQAQLNALISFVEVGNGVLTFQLRGIEFQGTQCQNGELQAIKDITENEPTKIILPVYDIMANYWRTWSIVCEGLGLTTYNVNPLDCERMWNTYDTRKLLASWYIKCMILLLSQNVDVADHIKSLSPADRAAQDDNEEAASIQQYLTKNITELHADLDTIFSPKIDEDFDVCMAGVTYVKFRTVFQPWVDICWENSALSSGDSCHQSNSQPQAQDATGRDSLELQKPDDGDKEGKKGEQGEDEEEDEGGEEEEEEEKVKEPSTTNIAQPATLVPTNNTKPMAASSSSSSSSSSTSSSTKATQGTTHKPDSESEQAITRKELFTRLCYGMSLIARRAIGDPWRGKDVKRFLSAVYSVFRGDCRIHTEKDQWIYHAPSLLQCLTEAIRLGLCTALDAVAANAQFSENDNDEEAAQADFDDVTERQRSTTICHECDSAWTEAIRNESKKLFSMRHTPGRRGRFLTVNMDLMTIDFDVVQLNKESVIGMWAGQQQEIVYFGFEQNERLSIQQKNTVLRNIVNSSMDVPIGYPVFVSPLTTITW